MGPSLRWDDALACRYGAQCRAGLALLKRAARFHHQHQCFSHTQQQGAEKYDRDGDDKQAEDKGRGHGLLSVEYWDR